MPEPPDERPSPGAWASRRNLVLKAGGILLASTLGLAAHRAPAAGQLVTEVIPLGFRALAEIIAVIAPLVPPPGVVTGLQNQLVVKTTRENLAEIKALLASLDRPPSNLLIAVRHELDAEIRRDIARAGVRIAHGDARISAGRRVDARGHKGATVRGSSHGVTAQANVQARDSGRSGRDTQRLRVLEGHQAFVNVGVSVPYPQRDVVRSSRHTTVIRSTEFHDFGTGFFVRPRLQGNQVTLEISAHRDGAETLSNGLGARRGWSRGKTGGARAVRETSTIVSGELGRWLELSGTSTAAAASISGIGTRGASTQSRAYTVYVKVELVR